MLWLITRVNIVTERIVIRINYWSCWLVIYWFLLWSTDKLTDNWLPTGTDKKVNYLKFQQQQQQQQQQTKYCSKRFDDSSYPNQV